jgi:hypothetical protein
MIAVGTLITERPPHRTERAPFGQVARNNRGFALAGLGRHDISIQEFNEALRLQHL